MFFIQAFIQTVVTNLKDIDYRCDPVAIVFIFELKSTKDIDNEFEGKLFCNLTNHKIADPLRKVAIKAYFLYSSPIYFPQ